MNNFNNEEKNMKRIETLKKYLDKLKRIHNNANTKSKKELLKSVYYNKYIIKEEELKKIISDKNKINLLINEQKESFDKWIKYLNENNYPIIIKYWIFNSVIKMGNYDSVLQTYNKRTKKTIYPYIDVNPLLISKCIKIIEDKSVIENIDVNKVLLSYSFKNIYTFIERNSNKEYKVNDGIWIKYNEGNKEDAIKLSNSLKGKNTHWCIENKYKAINQICGGGGYIGGDLYIYYSKDNEGKYTNPRIGIRMNHKNEIGEIRGIEYDQNVEEEMIPILENKLKEINIIDEFSIEENLQIINDLKYISNIYKKTIYNEELTNQELLFLYTIYLSSDRVGFGLGQDPIIKKIIDKRNILQDYETINDEFIKYQILSKCNIKI